MDEELLKQTFEISSNERKVLKIDTFMAVQSVKQFVLKYINVKSTEIKRSIKKLRKMF